EEVGRLGNAEIADTGADHSDVSTGNLRLDVAVIPGKAGANNWRGGAGAGEEEVRIAKESERGGAVGVEGGTHVKELLTDFVHDRALKVGAEAGAENAFAKACVRIQSADAGHSSFELADGGRAGIGIALQVGSGCVVEVVGKRRGVACGDGYGVEIEL